MDMILKLTRNELMKLASKFSIRFSINDKKVILSKKIIDELQKDEFRSFSDKDLKKILTYKYSLDNINLDLLKIYQLIDICKQYKIVGFGHKSKSDIIKLINNYISKGLQNIEKHDVKKNIYVSDEDVWILEKYKIFINKNNYVHIYADGKLWRLHRYIYIVILNNNLTEHDFIDHINRNKFDNRRENLRIVDASVNNKNRSKSETASSKYFGVFKVTGRDSYVVRVQDSTHSLYARFINEDFCAYQYDLWIDRYNLDYNKNNIDKPDEFKEYDYIKKIRNLPDNISMSRGYYRVQLSYDSIKYDKNFKTLENAKNYLNNINNEIKEIKIEKKLKLRTKEIQRNDSNHAIIRVISKGENKDIIIDDDIYHDLIEHKIRFCGNYAKIRPTDGGDFILSRYIMSYTGKLVVDHINNNTLDNRKCNLRIIDRKQNTQNKSKCKNSTSKYIGVSYCKRDKLWKYSITINGKMHSKYFKTEEDAVRAREKIAKEANETQNCCFKLNFSE